MTEDETSTRSRSSGLLLAGAVPLLLVTYALSIGPVNWCYERGLMSQQVLEAARVFYFPIGWIIEETDWGAPIEWYLDFWD